MPITVNKGYKDAQIINESPRSTNIHKDLNLYFTKHPVSSDVTKVTDVQAVKRSIRNLVLTKKGERLFHPEIGSDVASSLFETITPVGEVELENSIRDVIGIYEPRAQVTYVSTIDPLTIGSSSNGEKSMLGAGSTYLDANALSVSIHFTLLNSPNEIHQIDVLLEKVR